MKLHARWYEVPKNKKDKKTKKKMIDDYIKGYEQNEHNLGEGHSLEEFALKAPVQTIFVPTK